MNDSALMVSEVAQYKGVFLCVGRFTDGTRFYAELIEDKWFKVVQCWKEFDDDPFCPGYTVTKVVAYNEINPSDDRSVKWLAENFIRCGMWFPNDTEMIGMKYDAFYHSAFDLTNKPYFTKPKGYDTTAKV